MDLIVSRTEAGATLDWGAGPFACAVGWGGIARKRAEGDGITPVGIFPIRHILYRADRMAPPHVALSLSAIAPDDGWCDAPTDPNYNRPVKLPYPASAEAMWREDGLYDLLAILGFNDDPVVAGAGSAIFLHVVGTRPTAGCVALGLADLTHALEQLRPGDVIKINVD